MATVSESLTGYLNARKKEVPYSDLIDRWHWGMETQVLVQKGEKVADKQNTYTDGTNEWWPIRVDNNKDYELPWLIRDHVTHIGSTGWNWQKKRSIWIGADVDAVLGHAVGVGISDADLVAIRQAAGDIPWTEVRYSTGGLGHHLYVPIKDEGIEVPNHTVHAAIGRAILTEMSRVANFDFAGGVDVCGGNMWLDCAKPKQNSFEQITPATEEFKLSTIDYEQHLDVVTRKRTTVRVPGVPDDEEDEIDQLCASRRRIQPDETHLAIQEAMGEIGAICNYIPDHNLFQIHTHGLQQLIDDADTKKALNLKGVFKTLSPGTNLAEPNGFAFPEKDGAIRVIRFGQGVNETPNWEATPNGWIGTTFNGPLGFDQAMQAMDGVLLDDGASYQFPTLDLALLAIDATGSYPAIDAPEELAKRLCEVSKEKGNCVVTVVKDKSDPPQIKRFASKGSRPAKWVATVRPTTEKDEVAELNLGEAVRRVQNAAKHSTGYWMQTDNGWHKIDRSEVTDILQLRGVRTDQLGVARGQIVENAWTETKIHGKSEYPGNRTWNRDTWTPPTPQQMDTPYWDRILKHIGQALDSGTDRDPWCKAHGIKGRDYLFHWLQRIWRDPYCRLPAQGLYSDGRGRGKTLMMEGACLLVDGHFCDLKLALTEKFNGQCDGAIIGIIDEHDLRTVDQMALRNYVTGTTITVRPLGGGAYKARNPIHVIAASNYLDYFDIEPGCRRKVLTDNIPPFDGPEIDYMEFVAGLKNEIPGLLHQFTENPTPDYPKGLKLPTIVTDTKAELMKGNKVGRNKYETIAEKIRTWLPGVLPKTNEEIRTLYKDKFKDELDEQTMGRVLNACGAHKHSKTKQWNLAI